MLAPARVAENGYRIYGQDEVDRLQHILFYKELGMPLEDIRATLVAIPGSPRDGLSMLQSHLVALRTKRWQLDILIANVEKSILATKGEVIMKDHEKFEGFVGKTIEENEAKYGKEVREKYGNKAIDASNAKLRGMNPEQFAEAERLSNELSDALIAAMQQGDPAGALAQKAAELHKQWLCAYWPSYSKEAHIGVAQMYVDDPRFTAHYDKIAPGCAVFLRDAVATFCS